MRFENCCSLDSPKYFWTELIGTGRGARRRVRGPEDEITGEIVERNVITNWPHQLQLTWRKRSERRKKAHESLSKIRHSPLINKLELRQYRPDERIHFGGEVLVTATCSRRSGTLDSKATSRLRGPNRWSHFMVVVNGKFLVNPEVLKSG